MESRQNLRGMKTPSAKESCCHLSATVVVSNELAAELARLWLVVSPLPVYPRLEAYLSIYIPL
jgi:hypothetical protein